MINFIFHHTDLQLTYLTRLVGRANNLSDRGWSSKAHRSWGEQSAIPDSGRTITWFRRCSGLLEFEL